jgi:hypothetical protein
MKHGSGITELRNCGDEKGIKCEKFKRFPKRREFGR